MPFSLEFLQNWDNRYFCMRFLTPKMGIDLTRKSKVYDKNKRATKSRSLISHYIKRCYYTKIKAPNNSTAKKIRP